MRYLLLLVILLPACKDDSPAVFPVPYQDRDTSTLRDAIAIPPADATLISDMLPDIFSPECPLASVNEFVAWQACLPTGRRGVWCDKGRLHLGSCMPCSDEICDNIDNDCDNRTDEGAFQCDNTCGSGVAFCVGGMLAGCTAPPISDEACNGLDDDCDGSIDETLKRDCFSGPVGSASVGICQPGEQICIDGSWGSTDRGIWVQDTCLGEVLPSIEVCDGTDNDCDGTVDFGERLRETDILFIVDWSNSMGSRVQATLEALQRFSLEFEDTALIQWGLIVGPIRITNDENPLIHQEMLRLVSDIAPFGEFLDHFLSLEYTFTGGSEMLLDAVYLSLRNLSPAMRNDLNNSRWSTGIVSDPQLSEFVVSWRNNSEKIIVLFSDEPERTYMVPPNTIHVVEEALAAVNNFKVYTFALGFYGWDEVAVNSGGLNFELSENSADMYENLMTIITGICQ